MSSSKKKDLKRDFAAGVYLSKAQILIPHPFTHCICVYSKLIHTGGGGGGGGGRVEPDRRLEGQQFTKLGQKYLHDC